ncbi:MAG: AAA family ATPase [Ruminococcus sp.]|nr:AAA family ATPase [Ruminococcus sp.]
MTIKDAKQQILNSIRAYLVKDEFGEYKISIEHQRPCFLLGPPGIGKTAIMDQIAQETGVNLISYSMAHQTRESAMGLPVIVERNFVGADVKVSEYTMSEIIANIYYTMEQTGIREGILFLDEINCVSESLAPIMLQFLQYKIFGLHQVPPGWVLVTAGNPPQFNKSVNEFDIVTWDRFKKVECEADFLCWKEYAYYGGVHPAIIAYLELHPDHYYEIDATDRHNYKIITARAWEDLSEMLQLYEIDGIPVTLELIGQYLQDHDVAPMFFAFYCKFNELREVYDPDSILEGNITREAVSRAASCDAEEAIILMNLLMDGVTYTMRTTLQMESMIRQIHPKLEDILVKINEGLSCRQIIAEHIMQTQRNLDKAVKARIISPSKKKIQHWIIHNLEAYLDKCTNEGRDNKQRCTLIIQNAFANLLNGAKSVTSQSLTGMKYMFDFMEAAYGAGSPVMNKLLEELTINVHTMDFIKKYGSDEYYRLMNKPAVPPTYNDMYELNLTDCLEMPE